MRSVFYLYAILGISVLSIGTAHSVVATIDIHNKGNNDVFVAAVYRSSYSLWTTKGWWKVKPGALNWVEIETGINGSNVYYLSFSMTNDRGEKGYPKGMQISSWSKSGAHQLNIVDRTFCIAKNDQVTDRLSSVSELSECPPGYELAIFGVEVVVPIFGDNVSEYGTSSAGVFIHPEKSGRVIQVKDMEPKAYAFLLKNDCKHPIKFAIRYEDISGNWQTEGWWHYKAGQSSYFLSNGIRLKTKNDKWYIYAETTGKEYLNWHGKHNYSYDGRTLPMLERLDKDEEHKLTINCPDAAQKRIPAKPKSKNNVADRYESGGSNYPPLDSEKKVRFTPEGLHRINLSSKEAFYALLEKFERDEDKRLECVYGPSRPDGKGYITQYFWYKKVPLSEHEFSFLPDYPSWRNLGRKALDKCPSNGNEAELIRKKNWAAWKQ